MERQVSREELIELANKGEKEIIIHVEFGEEVSQDAKKE